MDRKEDEDVKVTTEGEQKGPSGSTAVKPLETKRRGSFVLGSERRPAFLADLSTAPERDCHLILPCALLSRRGPTAQRTGTVPLSSPHSHSPTLEELHFPPLYFLKDVHPLFCIGNVPIKYE